MAERGELPAAPSALLRPGRPSRGYQRGWGGTATPASHLPLPSGTAPALPGPAPPLPSPSLLPPPASHPSSVGEQRLPQLRQPLCPGDRGGSPGTAPLCLPVGQEHLGGMNVLGGHESVFPISCVGMPRQQGPTHPPPLQGSQSLGEASEQFPPRCHPCSTT